MLLILSQRRALRVGLPAPRPGRRPTAVGPRRSVSNGFLSASGAAGAARQFASGEEILGGRQPLATPRLAALPAVSQDRTPGGGLHRARNYPLLLPVWQDRAPIGGLQRTRTCRGREPERREGRRLAGTSRASCGPPPFPCHPVSRRCVVAGVMVLTGTRRGAGSDTFAPMPTDEFEQ